MSSLLVTNIAELVCNSEVFGELDIKQNAAFVVENEKVSWIGSATAAPAADELLDVAGAAVIPGFVDSHAHLIFSGNRAKEFSARMQGESYSAGGIATTVSATRAASSFELEQNARKLIREMHASGITTFETKSGYGLNVESELKSLKVAAGLTSETTFLGAHVVPKDKTAGDYVALVTGEMLREVRPYAKWIDVFCDKGAFNVDQSRVILEAGIAAGLKPRIHANQIENIGAIELAVELDCASADHCTHLSASDIEMLAASNTVATLLPGAEFSTRSKNPPAKALIEAGATVALATDCNPGSSYTTSMPLMIALAVTQFGISPAQALWAATMGGARALRRQDLGRLEVGRFADFAVLDTPTHEFLAYRPGVDLIQKTFIKGKLVHERQY